MGYSRSISTVRKNWALLEPFLARPSVLRWIETAEEAPRLAYKLRECRRIIQAHPDVFPGLYAVMDQYTIRVLGGQVTASLEVKIDRWVAEVPAIAPSTKGFGRVSSVEQIIQHWIDAQPCSGVEFVVAELLPQELEELKNWAGNMSWDVKAVGQGLQLTKKGVSL